MNSLLSQCGQASQHAFLSCGVLRLSASTQNTVTARPPRPPLAPSLSPLLPPLARSLPPLLLARARAVLTLIPRMTAAYVAHAAAMTCQLVNGVLP